MIIVWSANMLRKDPRTCLGWPFVENKKKAFDYEQSQENIYKIS